MKHLFSFLLVLATLNARSQKSMVFRAAEIPKPTFVETAILEWNQSQPLYKDLSKKEQEFYYWINYSRLNPTLFFDSAVMPIINVYPQLKGKNLESLKNEFANVQTIPLLLLNDVLIKMAISHAEDITSNGTKPSHSSTNGESFEERFKKFGLSNCGGENISFGGGDTNVLFMLVMLYLDINVPSLGHRKALMNPAFTATGINISFYKDGNTFLVQDFACSQK